MHRGGREIRLGGVTGLRKGGGCLFSLFGCISPGWWTALLKEVGGAGRGSHSETPIYWGMLLYCCTVLVCLFLFFFCPAVLCQSLVCLAAAQCTHVCMLLLKPPCRGIFERTKWEIICLYEWKGAKCLHSLVVTARFIAPSGGKHGGRENKWLALEGSYFTHAKTYWASLIIRGGGGGDLSFVFFGKLPYSCWKKVFWLRQRLSWNAPACDTVVLFNPQRIGRGFRRWSQTWPTRTLTGVFFLLLIRPGTDSCHVCEALTSPPGLNSAFGWIGTWNYYHHHGCGVYFKKLLVYMCLSVKNLRVSLIYAVLFEGGERRGLLGNKSFPGKSSCICADLQCSRRI